LPLRNPIASRPSKLLALIGSLALGGVAGRGLATSATSRTAFAEVTANVDRGSVFRLYFNNTWSEPQDAAIQPGQWVVYRFPVPGRLTALRFDPSDQAEAHARIRTVTIRSNTRTASITGREIQRWLREGVDVRFDPVAGETQVSSQRATGYLMGTVDIDVSDVRVPILKYFRLDAITLLWCGLVSGIALVLLSIPRNQWPSAAWIGCAIFASVAVAYQTAPWFLKWPGGLEDVSETIGHESFFGQSKIVEVRAAGAAFAVAVVSALLVGLLTPRRVTNGAPPSVSARPRFSAVDVAFLAGFALLLAIGAVPTAVSFHGMALSPHHDVTFDAQNFLTWRYLHALGALPWRDYWFPYSGMNDQLAPLYPEMTLRWAHLVLLFTVLLSAGYIVVERRKGAVLALGAVWFYLEAVGLITPGATGRYGLSLSVVLLGAVVLTDGRLWIAAAFGVWVAYVFVQEMSQDFYAVPPVVLLITASLLSSSSPRTILRRLMVAALGFVAVVVPFLIGLARHGQLAQWWQFVSTLDLISNYSATPAAINFWFSFPRSIDQFLVFITILAVAASAFQAASDRFADTRRLVPAALGLLSVMLLQKQILRPGMAPQVLTFPALALALLAVQQADNLAATARCRAWMAFSATLIVTCFTMSLPTTRTQAAQFVDIFSGVGADLRYSLFAGSRWTAARHSYFSPASVTFSGLRGDDVAARVQLLTGLKATESVFVLGNNSDLYMVLQRPVAFHPNLYNQSPLQEQRLSLAWIRDHDPHYLIWEPAERSFDDVPNPVRVPLIYNYATAQFVRLGVVGKFEILRRRRSDEPPDVGYWLEKLGASIELGYIPATSRALSSTAEGGDHRLPYLIVRLPSIEEGATYTAVIRLAGAPYSVRFTGRAGIATYPIALGRLPLAEAGNMLGQPLSVESLPAGATAEIKELRFSKEPLY
jgi:hypothetical protein